MRKERLNRMGEVLTRADVEEAMQKLKDNNGKGASMPDCLNRALLSDVRFRQWFRFVMTGIPAPWMLEEE